MIKKGIERRKVRNRAKINGQADCPRVTVFKSNKYLYVQAIDDSSSKVLASVNDKALGKIGKLGKNKMQTAVDLGKNLAEKLISIKIKKAVFNKGQYVYHGKVKAVADGLREGGITI